MLSRYGIFCRVIEVGSFTRVAEEVGYSQSAVSQHIKALEQELGTVLIHRRKDGIGLTADGEQFLPYLQSISRAEEALRQKQREMKGLVSSTIRIGAFTSVSRNILPPVMKAFKERHPGVSFVLKQGEYTSIARWIRDGSVDFGFVNPEAVPGLPGKVIYEDEMLAVLPQSHPLAKESIVSLRQLAREPFILLDEGEHSVAMHAFERARLTPRIEYEVYDDYSILAMVRQGLSVSAMYRLVVSGFEDGLALRPIREAPRRPIALAWENRDTLSYAARRFVNFIAESISEK